MVVSITRRPWYRLRVAGTQVELAVDPVQNEALEGVITRVLDAEIESTITLATNVTADIYQVEQDAATITAQFSGRVNHVAGQSFPNRVVLTCTGPLARLRRVPTSDHDLTGMTDGEAVQSVLDSCNITYTAGDIADAGYVLGAQTPVYWVKDQPGQEMIAELNRVFGMAIIEVGAGRIVRFAYDRAPSSANIAQTYTRNVDAEFWGNQRDRGDLDAIVNVWQVRGATWTDADGCSITPWARGIADNDALPGSARNRAGTFQSDLIQDEALAGAIATRMLRWYNRQPDELTVVALNDPNVPPGAVIGVKDAIYGVGLTAAATGVPYLVLTVDRRGDEHTLNCIGGAAGPTGTVTTGVEKRCNDTNFSLDIPGSFTLPTITVPPLIGIGTYDCPTHGGPNGLCPDLGGAVICDSVAVSGWVAESGSWTFGSPITVSNSGQAHAAAPEIPVGMTGGHPVSWSMTAVVQLVSSEDRIAVGIGRAGVLLYLAYIDGTEAALIEARTPGHTETNTDEVVPFDPGSDINVSLAWSEADQLLTVQATQASSGLTAYAFTCAPGIPLVGTDPFVPMLYALEGATSAGDAGVFTVVSLNVIGETTHLAGCEAFLVGDCANGWEANYRSVPEGVGWWALSGGHLLLSPNASSPSVGFVEVRNRDIAIGPADTPFAVKLTMERFTDCNLQISFYLAGFTIDVAWLYLYGDGSDTYYQNNGGSPTSGETFIGTDLNGATGSSYDILLHYAGAGAWTFKRKQGGTVTTLTTTDTAIESVWDGEFNGNGERGELWIQAVKTFPAPDGSLAYDISAVQVCVGATDAQALADSVV